jgi:hypothetical protein
MPSTLLDAPTLTVLHNPDVTPTEIRSALTCLVERMAEDAAPAFGMLLELDSQARELGIAVPALEDDEFASEIAVPPSDEPQSAVRSAADAVLLLHQRAEHAQRRRLVLVALLQAAVSRASRAPRILDTPPRSSLGSAVSQYYTPGEIT